MASPPPPDPYLALGVPRDAAAAIIKSQYRKLVLKFHPDKVQEESQKQAAADQFHKVQTAYEIVGDEDKRARYDAQCKLAELRKDVMDKQGARRDVTTRSPAFKTPSEAPRDAARASTAFYTRGTERNERVTPLYEERTPSHQPAYASNDYFDPQPKSGARREPDYERSSKRATHDIRERSKPSAKEAERARQQERQRRADKDLRQDRDRKTAYVVDDESDSDLDGYESHSRRMRQQDEQRRVRTSLYETATQRPREASGRGFYDGEERAHKLSSQYDGAQDYIGRTTRERERERPRSDTERRPSPVRKSSSKEKMEYVNVRRKDGRPSIAPRRDSERPKLPARDADSHRSVLRESGRRASIEIVDEPARRPPTLQQSKSSPPVIPAPFEKQRSNSLQIDREDQPPKMKRSETMPAQHTSTRDRDPRRRGTEPQKSSGLRQTEILDGLPPTPAATPEYTGVKPENKYRGYADDHEIPTPDGYKVNNDPYKTEVREPTAPPTQRYARSPSPIRRDDKPRAASARYASPALARPGQPSRTTSTQYVYTPEQGAQPHARPSMAREASNRSADMLYGELRGTRSPRPTAQSRYSPPEENVRYQKEIRPEDIRVQSGYGSRRASVASRPSYSRSGSGAPISMRG